MCSSEAVAGHSLKGRKQQQRPVLRRLCQHARQLPVVGAMAPLPASLGPPPRATVWPVLGSADRSAYLSRTAFAAAAAAPAVSADLLLASFFALCFRRAIWPQKTAGRGRLTR